MLCLLTDLQLVLKGLCLPRVDNMNNYMSFGSFRNTVHLGLIKMTKVYDSKPFYTNALYFIEKNEHFRDYFEKNTVDISVL